jgi:hypothetical protein
MHIKEQTHHHSLNGAFVSIFESELRRIAGISAARRDCEDGGDLFGLLTHGGRILILLATGSGPKAVHRPTYFAQDADFLRANVELITGTYAVPVVGSHHSHHSLGIDEPSSGDIEQVRGITTRNHFTRWCDIIATHIWDNGVTKLGGAGRQRVTPDAPLQVRINAFDYADPQQGQGSRCALRVLPGISPLRLALLASGRLDAIDSNDPGMSWPMDRIVCDSAERPAVAASGNLSRRLAEQCEELPEEAQRSIRFHFGDLLVVASVEFPGIGLARIRFTREHPYTIQAVHLQVDGGQSKDLSEAVGVGRPALQLRDVYERLCSSAPQGKTTVERQDPDPDAGTARRIRNIDPD